MCNDSFEERPAELIRPGDMVGYDGGGLMMVTRPSRRKWIRFVGVRVIHHGVIVTLPAANPGGVFRLGEGAEATFTPRQAVRWYGRRDYSAVDPCLCGAHRRQRGDETMRVPPLPYLVEKPTGARPAAAADDRKEPTPGPEDVGDRPEHGELDAGDRAAVKRLAASAGLLPPPAGVRLPANVRVFGGTSLELDQETGAPKAVSAARAAAGFLGDEWTARPCPVHGAPCAELVALDGRRVSVQPVTRRVRVKGKPVDEHRFHIEVRYPRESGTEPSGQEQPTASVRADRGPAVLARVIQERNGYERVSRAAEQTRQRHTSREAFGDRLAAHVPGMEITMRDPSVRMTHRGSLHRNGTVHVNVLNGASAILEFKWVDDELAEALMQTYGAIVCARSEAEQTKEPSVGESERRPGPRRQAPPRGAIR